MQNENEILKALRALADPAYQKFQSGLIPNLAPETVLGVRMPQLRRLARSLRGTPEAAEFLRRLPHGFYEENNLHGLLLCGSRSYPETVAGLDRFLPFVDNWATCDLLKPRAFAPRQVFRVSGGRRLPPKSRRGGRPGRCGSGEMKRPL